MSTKTLLYVTKLCSSSANRLIVCFCAALLLSACTGDRSVREANPSPQSSPTSSASPPEQSASALLYVKKTVVHSLDLASGEDEVVVDLRSQDVFASQTSPYLAYLAPGKPTTDDRPDFLDQPFLHIYDTSSGRDTQIGPGFSPLWHQGEARLAYLRPLEERDCAGEGCRGLTEVVTLDVASGRAEAVSGPGKWALLAWSGPDVLASETSDLTVVHSLPEAPGEDPLDIAPSHLWDASPDGNYVLLTGGGDDVFVSLGETAEAIAVELGRNILAEGAWAPNSSRIVASLLEPSSGVQEVVALSPDAPMLQTVQGSRGELGRVVWSPDSRSFFFVRDAGRGLEGVRCTSEALRCAEPVAWPTRAVPLAFTDL